MTESGRAEAGDPYLDWDAAYVLGALAPPERKEFEQHKLGCERCSRAVAELAGMAGLLGAASADRAPFGDPAAADDGSDIAGRAPEPAPPEILTSLLVRVRRRRRHRWQAVAATGLLAAAAIGLVIGLGGSHGPAPAPATPLAQLVLSPLHAQVRFDTEPWGTRLDVSCTYDEDAPVSGRPEPVEDARDYQLVVTDRAGNDQPAGSWRAGPGTTVWPTGSVGLSLSDIARVQIRSDSGLPLLQLNRNP